MKLFCKLTFLSTFDCFTLNLCVCVPVWEILFFILFHRFSIRMKSVKQLSECVTVIQSPSQGYTFIDLKRIIFVQVMLHFSIQKQNKKCLFLRLLNTYKEYLRVVHYCYSDCHISHC